MTINYQQLMAWPFPVMVRKYGGDESSRIARGFGAGLPGDLQATDAGFLDGSDALPMMAVALADGEFWQMRPESGIDWRRIVHAEECITMHQPLPPSGKVVITQKVDGIFDRGAGRGAVMQQQQFLHTEEGAHLATIAVTTMLLGDGGFGGQPYEPVRQPMPDDRAADMQLHIRTCRDDADAMFRLSKDLAASSAVADGQSMMRGVGCFGLAGRGILRLVCGNRPERLKRLGVRYVGPMFTDETVLLELWRVREGVAVFRMSSVERAALILNHCVVEFVPD